VQRIIEHIALAVHDGDDAALPDLLGRFAQTADLTALFALRHRLHQDLNSSTPKTE
jgi:hypothetical protein